MNLAVSAANLVTVGLKDNRTIPFPLIRLAAINVISWRYQHTSSSPLILT